MPAVPFKSILLQQKQTGPMGGGGGGVGYYKLKNDEKKTQKMPTYNC
jgi:hypothetical protein